MVWHTAPNGYFGLLAARVQMRFDPFVAILSAGIFLLSSTALRAQVVAHAGSDVTICAGGPVTLGGLGASGGTGPYTYSWSPAAGLNNAGILHPLCTTAITRTYTLTATDANGNSGTDQVTVTVNPTPTVSLSCTNAITSTYGGVLTFSVCGLGANPYNFNFTDASSALAGATYSITWGNGQSGSYAASGWSATQQFPFGLSSGTYTVQNTTSGNCSITVPFNVFVGEVPLGGLSVVSNSSICTGSPISFEWNNFSTNPPGTLYIVDYGDGVVDTLPQPPQAIFSHTYTTSSCAVGGEYTISWRITNPCDTRTGQIGQIRVSESPVAGFNLSQDTACVGSTVTATDVSLGQQAPTCTNPKHLWSISPTTGWSASGALGSDNGQPTGPAYWTTGATSLGITFTQPGTYTISDVTGNICGLDTLWRSICVEAPPQPAYTLSPTNGCSPLVSSVNNASTSPNSCNTRYNWLASSNSSACGASATASFSGGTNASSFEPQFTFAGPGNYTVTLQAINSCGTFPITQNVVVGAPPQVAVNPVSGICAGQTVHPSATFSPCGTPITGYTWSTTGGAPAAANTQDPGTITYPVPGNFTITATAHSACGTATSSVPLTVTSLPAAPVVGGPITLCVGETLNLSATPVAGVTFNWAGPNGFSAQGNNPSLSNITSAGQGVYTVTASSGGCSGPPSSISVTVNPPLVVSLSPAVPSVCAGNALTLTASGAPAYQWTVAGSPMGGGSSLTFTPAATCTVVVTGDDGTCTGSASTVVTVNPLPVVDAGTDPTFCAGGATEVLFPVTAAGTWSGDPNVTADGHFNPLVQGTFQLTYTVVSPQGCPGSDVVTVTVAPPPVPANAGPDTLLCQNSAPLQLAGQPAGGSWTGNISIGGLFTPATTGTFTVHYTVGAGSCSTNDQAVITVVPATTLNAGADQSLCIDAPVFALGATPVGGSWSGAGISGSDFDAMLAGAGVHVLTYVYADANGCTSAAVHTITVNPLPVVSAGNDTTFCDQPWPQTLTGSSPPNGTWSGTGVSPAGIFTPNGPGTVMLHYSYTDANGCSAADSLLVTVITITNPADAGLDTAICLNSTPLQLNGLPGGGSWSGLQVDPSGLFTPMMDGSFTLTYQVGTGSCVTQDQVEVTVHPLPTLAITAPSALCLDAGVQTLTAAPPGGAWNGTGITDGTLGTFDPATSGTGSFQVTYAYTDANGCSNTTTADIQVNPLPTAAFSNGATACTNAPFQFIDGSSGATQWDWDFGDNMSSTAASPAHVYTTAGTYTVHLTVHTPEGCTDTVSHPVVVWDGPTAAFDLSPGDGCGPLLVSLDNQSSGNGVSYSWDFGDGTGSALDEPGQHSWPAGVLADTTYTITLTATNFCGSVDSMRTIVVHPAPTALFGPDLDSGCSPWPVTFSNVTVGQADSYFWNFGDGSTSTTSDSLVHHTYYTGATDSVYTVTLAAVNACGSDTATYSITVLPNSVTAFFNTDTTSGCAPLTVSFTQFSIGANNWHWDLGDSNVSTAQNVTHTYVNAGTYTVTLFADNGCSFDTVSVVITVNPTPVADFSVSPGPHCAGTAVQFTNNTPAPAGLQWDFGDGGSSTLSAPAHSYAAAGTYNVTLSVASTNTPCPAVLTQAVMVVATPMAAFAPTPASGCIPLDVHFGNSSTGADFLQWNFGDGNTTTGTNPAHTYTAAGSFTVQLVAENLAGCTDTAVSNVTAFPLPVAAFTQNVTESCTAPASVQFTNASTGAAGYAWDFGNGTSSLLTDALAVYAAAGTFTITLVAANQYSCTDTASAQFTLHPTPVAAFSAAPQPACAGYPVVFTNLSVNASQFQWDLGDGQGAQGDSVAHTYPEGDYDVMLIATGEGGCTDTTVVAGAVHVDPSPTAAFTYEPMQSTSYALQFHNQSTGAISWIWDFGDGERSSEFAPLHLFPAGPGDLYPFCLVAINTYGCPDTLCQPVVAVSDPNIYAPNAFTPDGDAVNEDFLPVLNGFDHWRYHLYIFDRWGEVIHDSKDRYAPWDGTCKGKPVKSDVYVWKVVLNRNGDERVYYGHVTVVRGSE
jgi:gliding motility-associated-like protein